MKAVIIDGRGLFGMRRHLRIGDINFRRLYSILTKDVGKNPLLFTMPLITIPERPRNAGFAKALRNMGYKVVEVNAAHRDGLPNDDRYIIEHISKLDVNRITEVVLVGADGDFGQPLLEKLQAIAARHPDEDRMRGYVVDTRLLDAEGSCRVGHAMETLFVEHHRLVEFVELSDFESLEFQRPILLPPSMDLPPHETLPETPPEDPEASGAPNGNGHAEANGGVCVVFQTPDGKISIEPPRLTIDLLNALSILQRDIPGISVTYE